MMKRLALFTALLGLAMPATGATPERTETGEEVLLHLTDMSVPIVDAGRMDGVLRLSIVLQTHNQQAADALTAKMPEIQAETLSAASEFARLYASPYAPVDVERLIAELNPAINRQGTGIRKILITHVVAKEV